jgi:hypothetical protein
LAPTFVVLLGLDEPVVSHGSPEAARDSRATAKMGARRFIDSLAA